MNETDARRRPRSKSIPTEWSQWATRVPLETVVDAFRDGASAEEIVIRFPVLDLTEAYAVLAYYLRNCEAVDAYAGGVSRGARRGVNATGPRATRAGRGRRRGRLRYGAARRQTGATPVELIVWREPLARVRTWRLALALPFPAPRRQ